MVAGAPPAHLCSLLPDRTVLDAWDILYQQKAPILSTKVADEALNCIALHEQGCLVAVGCNNGNTSLLELSDSLSISHK